MISWQDLAKILQKLDDSKLQKFAEQNMVYLESESESEEIFQGRPKKAHAEVKIVNYLHLQVVNERIYIGSTKLTCSHCQAILQIFKNDYWETKGSHGSPEWLCKNPRIVSLDKKAEIVQQLAVNIAFNTRQSNFLSQTTSDLFTELLNPVE